MSWRPFPTASSARLENRLFRRAGILWQWYSLCYLRRCGAAPVGSQRICAETATKAHGLPPFHDSGTRLTRFLGSMQARSPPNAITDPKSTANTITSMTTTAAEDIELAVIRECCPLLARWHIGTIDLSLAPIHIRRDTLSVWQRRTSVRLVLKSPYFGVFRVVFVTPISHMPMG